ncbi:ABC transporter permease [Paracoccus sp. Z330]|uniref:ABC transporter permease n=1 Tax=Paracoccus onchidii TaxID=3017813 RepID=A0ABT4ZC51_9RHOB|nr:ABC transporter permease [Paracoccus onchidii]MDB6176717.1 ABC transporter permease [Paracoccus onchidii]
MLRYFARRVLTLALSLLAASWIIFLIVELVPGDPAAFMLGTGAQPETLAALRQELGLNRPLPLRYAHWLTSLLQGDFGDSFTYKTPISQMIIDRLQVSFPLAIMALVLASAIAFPAGLFAASRRGRSGDLAVMGATQLGVAVPNFWFAMLLVLLFAVRLRWFPAGGFPGWSDPFGAIRSLLLPALALALPQSAILARILRSALIEAQQQDYIRTARAKGLSAGQTLRRHALRNAMVSVLTIMGLQFSFLLAGAIIIENVFFLPGLGRLIFQAINQRDLIVVQSSVLVLVIAVMTVTFLVDLAYAAIDPRLRK